MLGPVIAAGRGGVNLTYRGRVNASSPLTWRTFPIHLTAMKPICSSARIVGLAVLLAQPALPALGASATPYDAQNASEACGYLPYRINGPKRFAAPRIRPDAPAAVGAQATYTFAWDLARPAFLAAEAADDLRAGRPVEAVRNVRGGALSLGEYMLFAAKQFDAPPPPIDTTDERKALAGERSRNFYLIYAHAKASFESIAAHLSDAPPPADGLAPLSRAWRPAFVLTAKAQADDKRIELLSTDLGEDAILEREAVVCLAHAVVLLGQAETADGLVPLAQAAAARWVERPVVNARALRRDARMTFFDHEDAGDALAAMIAETPAGPVDDAAMRNVAEAYAAFLEASKSLHEQTRPD